LTDHLGPSSPVREDARPEPSSRSRRTSWLELVLLVALTLAVAGLIRTFLVQPFFIPSESMENTLRVGDRVLVDKLSYRFHDIHRGDVVVFNGLDSFTPEVDVDEPSNPVVRALRSVGAAVGVAPPGEKDFIKRVIGVPGDRVVCCDPQGRVTVNGTALDEADYVFPGNVPSEATFDVTVPAGRLWVMGDHRAASADSRAHTGDPGGGTVPEDKVIGRAFSVVWPPGNMTGLGTPATFDRVGSPVAQGGSPAPYALLLGVASPCVIRRRRSGTEGLSR
jgi:signal peptidase I